MKLNWRIFFALTLLAVGVASAATLDVTSIADSGPGTLRDALANAADGDTINAAWVHGTIRLTSGELFVSQNVVITGPGPNNLTVDGNYLNSVFHIGSNVVAKLTGLTITHGAGDDIGGGIYNDHAMLTLINCAIINNFGGGGGAGISNEGYFGSATLNLVNSLVANNTNFVESSSGGGILNDAQDGIATVTLEKSIVRDNSTGYLGGGIFNDGFDGNATVVVVNSTLKNNNAYGSGGGIYNAGWSGTASVTLENSTVTENQAGTGGGVYNAGYGGTALVIITNCAITDNRCLYYGGGGGLFNGISGGSALMKLANSTISENSADFAGGIFSGEDYVVPIIGPGDASLQILNCTISDNLAEAIYLVNGAGTGTVEIGSTIINASTLGSTISSGSSLVTSLGYNLSSDDGGGVLTNATDLINTDPRLGPLRDNGGPTWTQALLPDSPAIDQGKNFSGSPFDQRGHRFARTFDNPFIPNATGGDGTDIGAFEVQTINPAQPVQYLLTLVNSQVNHPRSLRVILDAALTSINRNNLFATFYELEAFQKQVRVQVMPSDHALAAVLLQTAQDAINSLNTER